MILSMILTRLNKLPLLAVCVLFSALIISLLIILAGAKPGQMEYADMLTVNTSFIGQLTTGGKIEARALDIKKPADKVADKTKEAGKKTANKAIKVVAKDLGIKEWYSYHLMTFCEGDYDPQPVANKTHHPTKKATKCSKAKGFFHFDLAANIQAGLGTKGKNLTDLGWSEPLTDLIKGTKYAFNAVFLFYVLGLMMIILTMLVAAVGVLREAYGIMVRVRYAVAGTTTFLFLFATLIHSFSIYRIRDIINAGGNLINVQATVGTTFIYWSWAVTALSAFTVILFWVEETRVRRLQRYM